MEMPLNHVGIFAFLGFYMPQIGSWSPTFRNNL